MREQSAFVSVILSQKRKIIFCITGVGCFLHLLCFIPATANWSVHKRMQVSVWRGLHSIKMEESKMKILNKLVTVLLLGVVLGGCASTSDDLGYKQISMSEAVRLMEEGGDHILLDVRTPEEFAEGHIPNAINVPNETIGSENIAELPEKEQKIFVYCRSGNRSKQASAKLVKLGYTNIVEIGGIQDWSGQIVTGGTN